MLLSEYLKCFAQKEIPGSVVANEPEDMLEKLWNNVDMSEITDVIIIIIV
jgi:hypothetical protein